MKLTALLLLSLLALHCECCYKSYPFGHSNCTFEVSYNDLTCTDFSFVQCTYTYCASSYGCSDSSSSSRASYSTTSNNSWAFCTQTCCDPAVTYAQNAGSIEQCQAYLDWQIHLPVIIVMSIVAVLIPIGIIICCCCCSSRCPDCCQGGRDCCGNCCRGIGTWLSYVFCFTFCKPIRIRVYPRRGDMFSESSEIFQPPKPQQIELVKRQTSGTWKKEKGGNRKIEDVCGICHFDRPSIQLNCQHVFHIKCIDGSVRKREGCSVCGSDSNTGRVYCEYCSLYYFETCLMENLDRLSNRRQVCTSCGGEEVPREILK